MLPRSSSRLKLAFDCVYYYVTDMETSLAFYRDTLGLPLISEDHVARFDLDGVLIELVPVPPGTVVPENGNARMCFAVTDLLETTQKLRAKGIPTSDILHKKGGKLALFRDPDGNEIGLWEYDAGKDARGIIDAVSLHN